MTLIDKKFISDAHLNYLAQIINIFLGFVFVTLVIKFAGLSVYGEMTVVLAIGATISNLVSFRTNEAVIKFYRRGITSSNSELQYFAICAGLVFDIGTSLIVLLAIQIGAEEISLTLLKNRNDINVVQLLSYMAATSFLRGSGYGLLTAQGKFNIQNILAISEQLTKVLAVGLGVLFFGSPTLHFIMLLVLASSLPFTFIYVVISLRHLIDRPVRKWTRTRWLRVYWDFSVSTFISSTLKSGHKNLDPIIIGYFTNPTTVGLYNLFKQFISPLEMLSAPYAIQIYPKFVDALNLKMFENVELAIKKGTKMLFFRGIAIMTIVIPVAYVYFKWSNLLLTLDDYISFFILLCASFILQSLWWTRGFSLAIEPRLSITSNALAMITTFLLMPASIIFFGGILGAGLSTIICCVFQHIFWNKKLARYLPGS